MAGFSSIGLVCMQQNFDFEKVGYRYVNVVRQGVNIKLKQVLLQVRVNEISSLHKYDWEMYMKWKEEK